MAVTAAHAQAPSWAVPDESKRCPSKWGATDERGSGNHMKPASVLNAVKLIKTGEVVELAHVLGPTMPFFGTRRFDMHAKRTFMNTGSNERGSNEELVVSEIGRSARSSTASRIRRTGTAGTTASRSMRMRRAAGSASSASTTLAH
jgi:hypothetical protein